MDIFQCLHAIVAELELTIIPKAFRKTSRAAIRVPNDPFSNERGVESSLIELAALKRAQKAQIIDKQHKILRPKHIR